MAQIAPISAVDTFREAAPLLRRPFTPEAVKFKVQSVWPKNAPNGGLIVFYIDARLAVERLNLVVPHLWHDEYEPVQGGLLCRLTVDGITRQDMGSGYQGKGLYSDALKRAAVKFGIGVSLYASPAIILNAGEYLKQKQTKEGLTLVLTPNGETHVRKLYAGWLDVHGRAAFGEPIDHGDVEGAQGDTEVAEDIPEPVAPDVIAQLSQESVDEIVATIKHAKPDPEDVREMLIDLGVENVPEGALKVSTLRGLTSEQAAELVLRISAGAEVVDEGE